MRCGNPEWRQRAALERRCGRPTTPIGSRARLGTRAKLRGARAPVALLAPLVLWATACVRAGFAPADDASSGGPVDAVVTLRDRSIDGARDVSPGATEGGSAGCPSAAETLSLELDGDNAGALGQLTVELGQPVSLASYARQGTRARRIAATWTATGPPPVPRLRPDTPGERAELTVFALGAVTVTLTCGAREGSWQVQGVRAGDAAATPYAGLSLPDPLTAADLKLAGLAPETRRELPLVARVLTVEGTVAANPATGPAIFLLAAELRLTSRARLVANGEDYVDDSTAGAGGSGGGAPTGCGGTAGAGGSAGGDGLPAVGGTCMGSAGRGWGQVYATTFADYGLGGQGGAGTNAPGGAGGTGAGGGGGGTFNLWGGGAGGGGLIVIVADAITGHGLVRAEGGRGRARITGNAAPGAGGGGVIFVATRSYQGNLQASVQGGKSNVGLQYSGEPGTARIFQILPSGLLIRRQFTDRWTADGNADLSPTALPFAPALPAPSSLPDQVIATATQLDGYLYSRGNPLAARALTVAADLTYAAGGPSAVFLRAQTLRLQDAPTISATATAGAIGPGGAGGNGGAGAAGCGQTGQPTPATGGVDGYRGAGTCSAAGGNGWGAFYADGYSYGLGGTGGSSNLTPGGLGSNGGGGGGGGSDNLWGGGGGGGGLLVIVAERLEGSGRLEARGGDRGGTVSVAGGGGGGVIWVAAGSYDGRLTADVAGGAGNGTPATAGTARIFRLHADGSLEARSFDERW
ncbi:MAG: hypothetical protein IPL40_13030 [Proteobacteria bacterium]|nr:hypothetical protein [Pseudomonadota bacterium]